MYQYTDFDRAFITRRAEQFRDQLERYQKGALSEEEFRPLRLQNGWYIQRHAPMLRVAIPYGELSSTQVRALAHIAKEFDKDYGHLTTRQNIQYNWIPLNRSADVMDVLAAAQMHGIQTSGNCIRNITSDERAGIAQDEIADPRSFCEILRQWSTLHPEFAYLPRKFKIAVTGAKEDRAATAWHDIGLHLVRNEQGELGFRVLVGGGMGRTPMIGRVVREFLPWPQILNFIEAIVRVYNRYGRRDNIYKARIKILVKAEGEAFVDAVNAEFEQIIQHDGGHHTITQKELDRVSGSFVDPELKPAGLPEPELSAEEQVLFERWKRQNVVPHRLPGLCAVTLSLKRLGFAPGDVTSEHMLGAAALADQFSASEIRVTHDQNFLLPWVHEVDLKALWAQARQYTLARSNHHLLTDVIACPGGDFCALANARSIPIANSIIERYQDMDELHDLGEIDVHISGCINSCGHHHTGHIGILGVDKDGKEWYQVSVGGSDGSTLSGEPTPGKVVGPSFSAAEVADVIEALLETYRAKRIYRGNQAETFIDTVRRLGLEPFKEAAARARAGVHA